VSLFRVIDWFFIGLSAMLRFPMSCSLRVLNVSHCTTFQGAPGPHLSIFSLMRLHQQPPRGRPPVRAGENRSVRGLPAALFQFQQITFLLLKFRNESYACFVPFPLKRSSLILRTPRHLFPFSPDRLELPFLSSRCFDQSLAVL